MSNRAFLPGQLRLILAITLVHVVAWFAYYSQLPAGQYPGEAARATLESALALAGGTTAAGAGHSLHTYALSVLARFNDDAASLTVAARVLNAAALLLAVGCGASAAGHYWRRNRAVWVAGLLIGLNPVLVFWAGEVSPSLLATACMSMAIWRGLRWLRHPQARDTALTGICLTLAALLETVLLPFALLWPLVAFLRPDKERGLHLVLGLIPAAVAGGLLLVSNLQLQAPPGWDTQQFGATLYQALAGAEGYDGKSFGLYRQLHLILFLNPIHWSLILILATAGAYARLKDGHRGRSILLAAAMLALFALSYVFNGGGSQARATLIPLLAILAGGVTLLPKIWHHASLRTRRKIVAGGVATALFAYGGVFFGTPQAQTWERDYVYLAEANIRLGHNDRASTWAEKALELNPTRDDMQEVRIIAQFNDWAMGNRPQTLPTETTKTLLAATRQIEGTPATRAIQAIYLYKLREVEAANAIWQAEVEASALARLCLYWTGAVPELSSSEINAYAGSPYHALLEAARQVDRNAIAYGETEKLLDNMLAFAY